jgi:hypothetical protein
MLICNSLANHDQESKLSDLQSRLKVIEDTYQKKNKSLKQQLANEKKRRLELESSLKDDESVDSTTSVDYSVSGSNDVKAQGARTSGASQKNQEVLVLEESTAKQPHVRFENRVKKPTETAKQSLPHSKIKATGLGDDHEVDIHARSRSKRRRSAKRQQLDRSNPAPDSTSNVQKQQKRCSGNRQSETRHRTYVREG